MASGTEEELLEIYQNTKVEKGADAITKLLVQYVEKFGNTLVNERILSLNTQSLRYTNARLREWKRKKDSGEAKAEGTLTWLWNYMTEQTLLNSDFETLYSTFGKLPSLLVLGNSQESEIDLTFFTNIKNLEVQHCKVVFVRGAENIEHVKLIDCEVVDLDMFISLKDIVVSNSPSISWSAADKIVPIVEKITVSNNVKAITTAPMSPDALPLPTIKLKSLGTILSTQGGKFWVSLTDLKVNYCGLAFLFESSVQKSIIGLRYATNLETMDVSHNKIVHIMQARVAQPVSEEEKASDDDIIPFTRLTSLDLSFNQLQSVEKPSLYHFANLKTLNLSYNHIRSTLGIADALSDTLENLDLSKNRIDNWEEVKRLRGLKKLKSLNLAGNKGLVDTLHYRGLVCSNFYSHDGFVLDGVEATKKELQHNLKKGATDTSTVFTLFATNPINTKRMSIGSDNEYGTSSDETANLMEENLRGWHTLEAPTPRIAPDQLAPLQIPGADEKKDTKKRKKGKKGDKKKKKKSRIVEDIPEVEIFSPPTPLSPKKPVSPPVVIVQDTDDEPTDSVTMRDDYFQRMASNYQHASSSDSSGDDKKKKKRTKRPKKKKVPPVVNSPDSVDKTRSENVQKHLEALKKEMGDQWLLILSGSEYGRDASDEELSGSLSKSPEISNGDEVPTIHVNNRSQPLNSAKPTGDVVDVEEEKRMQEVALLRNKRLKEQRQKALLQLELDSPINIPKSDPFGDALQRKPIDRSSSTVTSPKGKYSSSPDTQSPLAEKGLTRTRRNNIINRNDLDDVARASLPNNPKSKGELAQQLQQILKKNDHDLSERERKTTLTRERGRVVRGPQGPQIVTPPKSKPRKISISDDEDEKPKKSDESILEDLLRDDDDLELPKDVLMVKLLSPSAKLNLDDILSKSDDEGESHLELATSFEDKNIIHALITPVTPGNTPFPSKTKNLDYIVEKNAKSVRDGASDSCPCSIRFNLISVRSPISRGISIQISQVVKDGTPRLLYMYELCEPMKNVASDVIPDIESGPSGCFVDGDKLAKLCIEGVTTDVINYYFEQTQDVEPFLSHALTVIESYYKTNSIDFFGELLAEDMNSSLTEKDTVKLFTWSKGSTADAMAKTVVKLPPKERVRRYSAKRNPAAILHYSVQPFYQNIMNDNEHLKKFNCDKQRPNVSLIVNGEANWLLHCSMHVFQSTETERLMHVIYSNFVVASNQPNVPSQEWSVAIVLSNRFFYLLQDCNYKLEGLEPPPVNRVLPMLVKQPLDLLQKIHISYDEQELRLDFSNGTTYLLLTRCKAVTKHIIQGYIDAMIIAEYVVALSALEIVTYQTQHRNVLLESIGAASADESSSSLLTSSIRGDQIRAYGQAFWKRQEGYDYPSNAAIHSHAFPSTTYLSTIPANTPKKRRVISGPPLTPISLLLSADNIYLCQENKLYDWPQSMLAKSYNTTVFAKRSLSEITHVERSPTNELELIIVFGEGLLEDSLEEETSNANSKPKADRWILVTQDVATRDELILKIGQLWSLVYQVNMEVTDGGTPVKTLRKFIEPNENKKRTVTISGARGRSRAVVTDSSPPTPVRASSVPTSPSISITPEKPLKTEDVVDGDYDENLIKEMQKRRASSRGSQKGTQIIVSSERKQSLESSEKPPLVPKPVTEEYDKTVVEKDDAEFNEQLIRDIQSRRARGTTQRRTHVVVPGKQALPPVAETPIEQPKAVTPRSNSSGTTQHVQEPVEHVKPQVDQRRNSGGAVQEPHASIENIDIDDESKIRDIQSRRVRGTRKATQIVIPEKRKSVELTAKQVVESVPQEVVPTTSSRNNSAEQVQPVVEIEQPTVTPRRNSGGVTQTVPEPISTSIDNIDLDDESKIRDIQSRRVRGTRRATQIVVPENPTQDQPIPAVTTTAPVETIEPSRPTIVNRSNSGGVITQPSIAERRRSLDVSKLADSITVTAPTEPITVANAVEQILSGEMDDAKIREMQLRRTGSRLIRRPAFNVSERSRSLGSVAKPELGANVLQPLVMPTAPKVEAKVIEPKEEPIVTQVEVPKEEAKEALRRRLGSVVIKRPPKAVKPEAPIEKPSEIQDIVTDAIESSATAMMLSDEKIKEIQNRKLGSRIVIKKPPTTVDRSQSVLERPATNDEEGSHAPLKRTRGTILVPGRKSTK